MGRPRGQHPRLVRDPPLAQRRAVPVGVRRALGRDERDARSRTQSGRLAKLPGLQVGDQLHSANGSRVLTIADLQFVLNGLDSKSKLVLDADRDGQPVTAELNLEGDWRRWYVSWRKSVRLLTWRAVPFFR